MAAHREDHQRVRITKTVGALAITGVAGVGLAVFSLWPTSDSAPVPGTNVGAVVIDPTPDATTQPVLPTSPTPTPSVSPAATSTDGTQSSITRAAVHPTTKPTAAPSTSKPATAKPTATPSASTPAATPSAPSPSATPTTPDPSPTAVQPTPDPSATDPSATPAP